jgi:nitrite reductase/ring-hydroxylating ferredoxin subunit
MNELRESKMAEAGWVRVASVGDVAEGQVHAVRVGDHEIALYHLPDNDFRATDNICTHEYAQLSDGWLEDGCIECPLHAARFDVKTGKALCAPAEENLQVFEVKVEGTDLLVKV